MKKSMLALVILLSFKAQANDTSYVVKREKLYMTIRQEVKSPSAQEKIIALNERKHKRKNRLFIIGTSIFFGTISAWYWSK